MTIATNSKLKQIVRIGITTNIVMWYDFLVFAYLAKYIGHAFFNTDNPQLALMYSLVIFTISYLVRPISSIFWGYIGDKYSSGLVVKYTTILMGLSTIIIGILPSYRTVGILSPLLLAILRVIQGFASSGELPMTASYIYENSNLRHKQILLCALPSIGSMSGALFASIVTYILSNIFSQNTMNDWAWRIPFLISLPLFFVVLRIRRTIITQVNTTENAVSTKLKDFIRQFLQVLILTSFLQISFYTLFIWLPNYLEFSRKIAHNIALLSNIIGLIAAITFTIIWGYIANTQNYKKILFYGISSLTLFTYPLLMYIGDNIYFTFSLQIIFGALIGCIDGVFFYAISHIFSDGNRNRGVAIAFTCASAYFGGTAPLICNYISSQLHFTLFPAVYIFAWGIIAIAIVFSARKF